MTATKKICQIAALTALYVVLSAFLKINIIGNIQIDLGYIAFAVALCEFGVSGAIVGIAGCAIESILFSAYGFSISWVAANAVIGIGCGLWFGLFKRHVIPRIVSVVLFSAIGLLGLKTVIECYLYSIPFAVKIPKNAVAFAVDAAVMIVGIFFHELLRKRMGSEG